jgi:hypothetical protein
VNKQEFRRRLERAGERARRFAQKYVVESLPPLSRYILPVIDDPNGKRAPEGMIKFFGGRLLKPEALHLVPAARAADLLWIDGRVPAWVNLSVTCLDGAHTHIRVRCCRSLVPADETVLPRDLGADAEDPIEPFRIRGPRLPAGWKSVEASGRISLLRRGDE